MARNPETDRIRLRAVAWVACVTLSFAALPARADLAARAYVVSPKELNVIDERDFSLVEGKVPLNGEPLLSWWNTLDQKRLALVTRKKPKRPARPLTATAAVIVLPDFEAVSQAALSVTVQLKVPPPVLLTVTVWFAGR